MPSSHRPDTLTVVFDDIHAVANAGLVITATLAQRLVDPSSTSATAPALTAPAASCSP
jgi:hypothetical protein